MQTIIKEELFTPPDIRGNTTKASNQLIPLTSKDRYMQTYSQFKEWQKSNKTNLFTENILLAYFEELQTKFKSSTLWSHYSMLKSIIKIQHNIDIATYHKLKAFIKQQSTGYVPTKAKVFTSEELQKFLNEAPDREYLVVKVILIFGIMGGCRSSELVRITVNNVEEHKHMLLVKIPVTKTQTSRSFTIDGNFYNIVKHYQSLRPAKCSSNRFFLTYKNGKCTKKVIGKNKIGALPKIIAYYLNLPNPECYTGHCFRRTSTTLLENAGADITTIKRHVGWKSTKVAEGYIEDNIVYKQKTGTLITNCIINDNINNETNDVLAQINNKNITFNITNEYHNTEEQTNIYENMQEIQSKPQLIFNNCNVTINYD